jgi:hypothetical protein
MEHFQYQEYIFLQRCHWSRDEFKGSFCRTVSTRMAHNGPAIWGGCVTRREHRAESWYFSREVVTVQGGYGALFAVMVQILLSITRVAVQA